MKKQNEIVFYCDNCSLPRISKKHTVRLTSDGTEIVKDVCEYCSVSQEIEFDARHTNTVEKFRIKSEEDNVK